MDWEKYRQRQLDDIREMEDQLQWMIDSQVRFSSRTAGDPQWTDTTDETIARHKDNIETRRNIIRLIDERIERGE
ncbi:hypothetical protein CN090_13225 [Sinorhizobium meliloti]|uniref:hypothetical protein n=1 Tax=Rhizobium meliloti TaxID=382 RepID=UPI000FDC5706|nr:hypothetical protein [Sinorhizobium meliloti]RVO50831.1 hypothetical protein CN090_13225 [Sinorhizobium meliloti]